MKTTTAYKKFEVTNFESEVPVKIGATRIGVTAYFHIHDLSRLSGISTNAITAFAGPERTLAINPTEAFHSPACTDPLMFVSHDVVQGLCDKYPGGQLEVYRSHFRQIHESLISYPQLIASGAKVSARTLHRALDTGERFADWCDDVVGRNPANSRDTGFRKEIESDDDFPVPLNLAKDIAVQAQTFAGMVVTYAISNSGFFDRTLLREPFEQTLERYRGLILGHPGIVDARQLHQFLGFECQFEVWFRATAADFPLEWGTDYFSAAPIDFRKLGKSRSVKSMVGELFISSQLAREIVASDEDPLSANSCFAFHYFTAAMNSLTAAPLRTSLESV